MSINKPELRQHLLEILTQKILKLEQLIEDTRASNNDTKSSMGDKYETSREMLQQQINNLQLQLNELKSQHNLVKNLNITDKKVVSIGSYVVTSLSKFFIAVSLGEIKIENEKLYVISDKSPIALALQNHKKGDVISFNGQKISITEIS
ncbi:hypothetical protein [Soonwooa sp.]|uniref:hypothetical protein n=1 Tax=Soonwooa sp. TaxID=1938592 RepID=UPI00289F8A6A|nr:hypothetical protein [Soonwooa sp.]